MERDGLRFRRDEAIDVAGRLRDHQVHVERQHGQTPESRHHVGPEGDVVDEVAVHHVEVQSIGTGALHLVDDAVEAAEVGIEDTGRDLHPGQRRHQALASGATPLTAGPAPLVTAGSHRSERGSTALLDDLTAPPHRGRRRRTRQLRRQLTTSGADIDTSIAADGGVQPDRPQSRCERLDTLRLRRLPGRMRHRIHGDEVDVRQAPAQQRRGGAVRPRACR